EHAEVIRPIAVFPDVLRVQHEKFAERLFKSRMVLISCPRAQRVSETCIALSKRFECIDHSVVAAQAGENQVLIKWRLERVRVGDSQHGPGSLQVVRQPEPWLRLRRFRKS